MMKRFCGLLLFLLVGATSAQALAIVPSGDTTNPFFGQKHSYSVTMRSDGRAVVLGRLAFAAPDNERTAVVLQSDQKLDGLTVYQQTLPPRCADWKYDPTTSERECAQWNDPDYYEDYGYWDTTARPTYDRATVTAEGDRYTITLPKPVVQSGTGAVVLTYQSREYTTARWGSYKYHLAMPAVEETIQSIHVSVSGASDTYFRGAKSDIAAPSRQGLGTADLALDVKSSESLQKAVDSIGYGGVVTKDGSQLAAGEHFTVKGEYATSWWGLYGSRVAGAVLLLVILFGLLVWWSRRKRGQASASTRATAPAAVPSGFLSPAVAGYGLLAAIVTAAWTVGTIIFFDWISSRPGVFNYSATYDGLMMLILLVAGLLMLAATFVVPVVVAWHRRRALTGVAIFGWQLIFLILTVIFMLMVGSLQRESNIYPAVRGVSVEKAQQ